MGPLLKALPPLYNFVEISLSLSNKATLRLIGGGQKTATVTYKVSDRLMTTLHNGGY